MRAQGAVPLLREREQVALVVMISELGLSNNIRLRRGRPPGIDVILSSDMHEITASRSSPAPNHVITEVGRTSRSLASST